MNISEYEQFMIERPNATESEIEARFGLPANELARIYQELCRKK